MIASSVVRSNLAIAHVSVHRMICQLLLESRSLADDSYD